MKPLEDQDSSIAAAEAACIYIEDRVRRASGHRWLQGPLIPALSLPASGAPVSVRLFAERRLHRVPSAAARALVAWARGERRVDLLYRVPSPREVLALQAAGRRCVSLLADDAQAAPHADGLAFAVHDLCHLEKFSDPEHYVGQVGFSALVDAAMGSAGWARLEEGLDALWAMERDHVIADMNGSAVFLLLALKSKLKIATRRRLSRERGEERAAFGPMDAEEQRAWGEAQEALLALLDLRGSVGEAARALSERGGAPGAEAALGRHFQAVGEAALVCIATEL